MKVLIDLLISMTLSGTLAFLAYLILFKLFDKYTTASLRYLALKLCLMFYLVPLPMMKHLAVCFLNPDYQNLPPEQYVYTDSNIFFTADGGILFHPPDNQEKILFTIWLILIVCCKLPVSPFTFGNLTPTILLTSDFPDEDARLIIEHELRHIKTHDFTVRTISLLSIVLHCFNPFIYFFFRELKEVQELNCDERLKDDFSKEELSRYGYLLVNLARADSPSLIPTLYFSQSQRKSLYKRVMKISSSPRKRRFLSLVLVCLLISLASMPVLAFSPVTIRFPESYSEEIIDLELNCTWSYLSFEPTELFPADEQHFQYTDTYLFLEDGTVIVPDESAPSRASCSHNYVSADRKYHALFPDASCTVYTYRGIYCTKCNYALSETYLTSTNYGICPH